MIEFLEESGRFLKDVLERIGDNPDKLKGHHGTFTNERDIISSRNGGFSVTGARNLSNKLSYNGMLVCGSTGAGKTASVICPTAYTIKNSSLIFNDPSGELFLKISGFLKSENYDVKVLNFSKPEQSCGYNPLFRARTSSDIQKLASMLIDNTLGANAKDPFWNLSATGLLTTIISVLRTQKPEFQTLFNVRQILNALGGNPKSVDKLFIDHASETDYLEFKSFLSQDEKIQSSVIQTAKASLQIFTDPNVAKLTSFDSLDLESFRTKPIALFVTSSIGSSRYFSSLVSILFHQFVGELLERFPADNERDIFFLLDEAGSSLKIPVLSSAMANLRKHKVGVMLLVQSESQLIQNYSKSDAESILANCVTKLYMTGMDIETAQRLENIMGKVEIRDEDDNNRKNVVPLLSADTIRSLPVNKAILLCSHHRPALVKLYPFYENPKFRRYSQMPTPEMKCQLPFFNIPVLALETPDDNED